MLGTPELIIFSIVFGVLGFIILMASPMGSIGLIIILQAVLFFHYLPQVANKWVFGAIYPLWLITWAISYLGRGQRLWWHPMAKPAMALAIALAAEVLMGLLYGSDPLNVMRDASPYLGYLAVFPVIDVVRSPQQAKKIIKIFAFLGLPAYVLGLYEGFLVKQNIGEGGFSFAPNAAPYWEPIQGAIWAVALCYNKASPRLAAWGWLGLSALIPIFGGMRGIFLAFLVGAATAVKAASRLGRRSLGRYVVPLGIGLVLVALLGLINPFSKVTTARYGTLTNLQAFENDPSVQGRIIEIRALLDAFWRNPATGVGFGYPVKYYWGDRKIDTLWFTYHNGYAETLMKFGLIGSLICAWFYWSALRMSYRLISSGETFFAKAMALGTVVWLVSALVRSVGNSQFSTRGFPLTFGIMVGLLPALAGQNPFNRKTPEKPPDSTGSD